MASQLDGYDEKRLAKLRKQFGEDLTYSTYKKLIEIGFIKKDIAIMYGISISTLYKFVKAHEEVLGA